MLCHDLLLRTGLFRGGVCKKALSSRRICQSVFLGYQWVRGGWEMSDSKGLLLVGLGMDLAQNSNAADAPPILAKLVTLLCCLQTTFKMVSAYL